MASDIKTVTNEAQILSGYLIGEKCPDEVVAHYTEAINKHNAILSNTDYSRWKKMMSSKFYLKLVDSGLAVTNSQSPLRKRIFIMLAILEASPDFTKYFLPQERSIFYLIPLGLRAMLSAAYMVLGILTVKALKVN